MSNFFTKEERNILDKYESLNQISCSNFIKNFIFLNPLNYPISAQIISSFPFKNKSNVKELYDATKIISRLKDHNVTIENILYACRCHSSLTFTSLVLSVIYAGHTTNITVVKNNNKVTCILICGEHCYYIINNTCTEMIVISELYYSNIITIINSIESTSFSKIKELINQKISRYALFSFNVDQPFSTIIIRSIILSMISGINFRVSRDISILQKNANILKIINSLDKYCTISHLFLKDYIDGDFIINNDIDLNEFQQDEVVDFEGMDSPIQINE